MKTNAGNFFEDFKLGQTLHHATPRTLTDGDRALYTALYGSRFALQSGDAFANHLGFHKSPVDDLLVFHTVFGKSVPDISLNAVANLGYAEGRFMKPVYPGETLTAISEVIVKTHQALARSPAAITLASLEDGLAADKRPNLPGASEDVRPNWCIPLPKKLEEIETDSTVLQITACLKR